MQGVGFIREPDIEPLLVSAFKEGNPIVLEGDSELDKDIKQFDSASEVLQEIRRLMDEGRHFFQFAIHYPDAGGHVELHRIQLNPKSCSGHTFRYVTRGWGLIYMQFRIGGNEGIECRVAVNSEERARGWHETYSELRDPSLWRWKVVGRNARRIIRALKKHAQLVAAADPRNRGPLR